MGEWTDVPLEFVDPDDVENPLRFVYVVPETLDENPNNWRIHTNEQSDAVDESLDAVGWAGVALYNVETQRLIDGHLRRDTAIVRGEPIPSCSAPGPKSRRPFSWRRWIRSRQ